MALNVLGPSGLSHTQQMLRQEKIQENRGERTSQTEIVNDSGGKELEELTPAALLQRFSDSVDEMSVLLSQFRHRRDFEKKVGASNTSSFEQVLDDDVLPKVDTLLKIAAGPEGKTISTLLSQLRLLFPDVSDLVVVLRELLRRRDMDKVVKSRLQKLLQHVEQTANPRRLKAGINVALKARLFGKALQLSPALARETYRNFLESDEHEIELYQDWISTYGAEKRAFVIDFMESSLLADIDAQDPSCSQIEFGGLLQRLLQLKLIRTSDILFIGMVFKNRLLFELEPNEEEWLLFMFCLLQSPKDIKELLESLLYGKIMLCKPRDRGGIFQTLYQACVKLPRELFVEADDIIYLTEEFERMMSIIYNHEQREGMKEVGQHPTGI
ncbi:type III secretion system gatekeeper subunit SctW [Serratia liquefaciens]|uniref:type III secretion system gatekeeper subunit SctW n=1 Tax=Serratia liquefaciens TaxID=614 RepID=UPI00215716BF|nr:type III secretion system gatekeeper subunit SctW [Serratia liquefaciens]